MILIDNFVNTVISTVNEKPIEFQYMRLLTLHYGELQNELVGQLEINNIINMLNDQQGELNLKNFNRFRQEVPRLNF